MKRSCRGNSKGKPRAAERDWRVTKTRLTKRRRESFKRDISRGKSCRSAELPISFSRRQISENLPPSHPSKINTSLGSNVMRSQSGIGSLVLYEKPRSAPQPPGSHKVAPSTNPSRCRNDELYSRMLFTILATH